MRIGLDGKRYFNNPSGLGNFSRSLVHALAQEFPNDEFILFSEKPELPKTNLPNLSVFHPSNGSKLWRSFGLKNDALRLGIDVFHGLSNEIPVGLKNTKIRTVVTIHDVIFKRYPGLYPFIDRKIYDWKTKYALGNANATVAASHATAADLTAYYGFPETESTVIYQPVHSGYYLKTSEETAFSQPYFIYVSSFTRRKNHGALIEAFAKIQKQCDWNLVLAGLGGETLHEIRNFIHHEKLDKRIILHTDVALHDLILLMQQASGFVYPSLFEGFGIPLAEAAVCGLPMAVSDIPVFRELAEDAALYFHPNKPEEIADSMLQLSRGEHQARLNQSRLKVLEKINPRQIAQSYMAVYRP